MRIKQEIGHSLVKALRSVPGFSALDDRDLLQIVGVSVNLHWPTGALIFEQGTPAEALYIVLSGRVQIYVTDEGRQREVATIGPGEFFGEFSLLRDATHSKCARSIEDSELMIIPKGPFQRLLSYDTELADHVSGTMEQRLRANDAVRTV